MAATPKKQIVSEPTSELTDEQLDEIAGGGLFDGLVDYFYGDSKFRKDPPPAGTLGHARWMADRKAYLIKKGVSRP